VRLVPGLGPVATRGGLDDRRRRSRSATPTTQPPKPAPVSRAPSAPASISFSTSTSSSGVETSKSSRRLAWLSVEEPSQRREVARGERLGRREHTRVLGDHVTSARVFRDLLGVASRSAERPSRAATISQARRRSA
jgi:hypothetical protein